MNVAHTVPNELSLMGAAHVEMGFQWYLVSAPHHGGCGGFSGQPLHVGGSESDLEGSRTTRQAKGWGWASHIQLVL